MGDRPCQRRIGASSRKRLWLQWVHSGPDVALGSAACRSTPPGVAEGIVAAYLEALPLYVAGDQTLVDLERSFIAVARTYAVRAGIGYAAWREVGVAPDVLARSGITPDSPRPNR